MEMEREQRRPAVSRSNNPIPGSNPQIMQEADAIKAILQQSKVGPTSLDEKSQRRLGMLYERQEQFDGAIKGIREMLQPKDRRDNAKNEPQGLLYNIAYTGYLLLGSNLMEQHEAAIQREGLPINIEDQALRRFSDDIGAVYVEIGGVSIRDVMNNNKVSPYSGYRFFTESYSVLISPKIEETKVFGENASPLTIRYPNLTRGIIYNGSLLAFSISVVSDEFFEKMVFEFLQNKIDRSQKNIIGITKRLVRGASDLKDKIFFTVLDPQSPDFSDLKGLVEKDLVGEALERQISVVAALGIDDARTAIDAYRKAHELSGKNNPNSTFYRNLASCIWCVVENCSAETVPTKDDLFYLINPDVIIDNKDVPTFEDLKRTADSIFQKSSQKQYEIDPEKIDWKNLVAPTFVAILFPHGNSQIFIIDLIYKNEDGEELILKLLFDPKKQYFDWYARESPDDPQVQILRQTMFQVACSIIADVQKQSGVEYQKRQEVKSTRMKLSLQPTIRTKTPQITWALRQKGKGAKRRFLDSLDQIGAVVEGRFTVPIKETQETVKKHIAISDNENTLKDMMEGISHDNQNMIIEAIGEFNERHIGEFKRLKKVEHQGEKSWELRAGDFRVLVIEIPSQNGDKNNQQTFEIYKISHKKDTFRGRKKQ